MTTAEPNITWSPGWTSTGWRTRQPFTRVPLVDPVSASSQRSSSRTRRACQRDTEVSSMSRSQASSRPMVKLVASPGPAGGKNSARGGFWGCAGGRGGAGWAARRSGSTTASRTASRTARSADRPPGPLRRGRSVNRRSSWRRSRAPYASSTRRRNVSWDMRPSATCSPSSSTAWSRSESDARMVASGLVGASAEEAAITGVSAARLATASRAGQRRRGTRGQFRLNVTPLGYADRDVHGERRIGAPAVRRVLYRRAVAGCRPVHGGKAAGGRDHQPRRRDGRAAGTGRGRRAETGGPAGRGVHPGPARVRDRRAADQLPGSGPVRRAGGGPARPAGRRPAARGPVEAAHTAADQAGAGRLVRPPAAGRGGYPTGPPAGPR